MSINRLIVSICLFLLINLFISQPAYSRGGGGGGCFSAGTLILTPEGNKPIEQLHVGDHVVNYNFDIAEQDWGTISNIDVINASQYYLINHHTKVTGTHPFYLQTKQGIKLTQVQNLHQGDHLINQINDSTAITSIDHIFESIPVYNLISIEPNHNFYADNFLVHNKGGSGGGGGSYGRGGSGQQPKITKKNFLGFLQALAILSLGLSCVVLWRQIYNFISYIVTYKNFTEDSELIEFTKNINPFFENKYSIWYGRDDQIWQQVASQTEVPESEYQNLINKTQLLEKVEELFLQYQQDWVYRDFQSMRQYVLEPFYNTQKGIFARNYGNNYDIVYDCYLSQIVPIDIELEADKSFFRLQINGSMINFKLSPDGYVLSGVSTSRSFTEYWDIKLTSDKICYLVNINQTLED